jgi:hypothetical protein
MTEQAQIVGTEGTEIPSATPRLIELLTPTDDAYAKLIHVNLFKNPEDPEDNLLKMEYLTPPTSGDGFYGEETIEVSENEFYGQIVPLFGRELIEFPGDRFHFGRGETLFQDIQEGLLAIERGPASERRRLTSLLVGLAEVHSEFELRDPIDEIVD